MSPPFMRRAASILALSWWSCSWIAGCGKEPEPAPRPSAAAPPVAAPEAAAPAAEAPSGAEPSARPPRPKGERAAIDPATAGTVSGRVRFDGTPPPRKPMEIGNTSGCEKHPEPALTEDVIVENGRLQNVFVHVKSGLDGWLMPQPSPEPVVLDQEGCMYRPRVLGMCVGQKLVVHNSDGATHNVHSRPKRNEGFNRSQPPAGTPVEWTAEKAEVMIPFGCDIHPWMKAWLGVRDHPFFAVSGADGTFTIAGLPPGEYTLEAWHENLGTKTGKVTLSASGKADIEFVFTAK